MSITTRPLPNCPHIDDIMQHPVYNEIRPEEEKSHERTANGGWREKQRWWILVASVSAHPVTSIDSEYGLEGDEDQEAIDNAIDYGPDWGLTYMVDQHQHLEVLVCGICRAEFSWENGADSDLIPLGHTTGHWELTSC